MSGQKRRIERFYTKNDVHPYQEVTWQKFDAVVKKEEEIIFEQKDVEFPSYISQSAVNIIASKYFKGIVGTKNRESSFRELIDRVVNTNVRWGEEQNYFIDEEEKKVFTEELTYILLHQLAFFNSPVWFNMGFSGRPQTSSACFINSVEDNMESILDLTKKEGTIFKAGSGSGVNVSSIRSKYETLSAGGVSSGVLSFMVPWDKNAGSIKSGGTTRRAAKMVILNVDHPEIVDFIMCKVREEDKAQALIREGYDSSYNGDAYATVAFQNENHTVRVDAEFMKAVENDEDYYTKFVTTGKKFKKMKANLLLKTIAEATYRCGDPAIQFDDIINKWNTCKTVKLNSSNPCSEYLDHDNTSCNLSSINLLPYWDHENRVFDVDAFVHTCKIMSTAQDIWIDKADYPIESIEKGTKQYRTIGIGYANLGALLMCMGFPYDSDDSRLMASSITSLMTSATYENSARNASHLGAFPQWTDNQDSMINVLMMHQKENSHIKTKAFNENIVKEADKCWSNAIKIGKQSGFRNSYVSNLAPTGTIGMAMDCDTTGVEPDAALVKYKKLAGSDAVLKIVNQSVGLALKGLGYNESDVKEIKEYVLVNNSVVGCPKIKEEHIAIFDTALGSTRQIHYMGHLKMLSAIQPFISGGISKTINMPEDTTVEQIMDAYIQAYKMGIKCVAIYRDNSKGSQPLSVVKEKRSRATRVKLPDTRYGHTQKVVIDGHDFLITANEYADRDMGELLVVTGKEGSTMRGLLDCFAIAISIGLQYGVPLKVFIQKFLHTKFDPNGMTTDREIPMTTSVIDYAMRHLARTFLNEEEQKSIGINGLNDKKKKDLETETEKKEIEIKKKKKTDKSVFSGHLCPNCGTIMEINGSCRHCTNCGTTTGCS